jgi:uracil phosphoribosyltransferase
MTKALEQLTEAEYEVKLAISVLLQRQVRDNRISKISVLREATTMLQEVSRMLESVKSTE